MNTSVKINPQPPTSSIAANETFKRLYNQLNPEQKKAVDTIEGPLMVIAGPGTGKTQVLALRVANILRQTQMDPWNILCLTFTATAAVEMRQRLIGIIGQVAYQVKIYTFHGFCHEIIRDNPDKFSFTASGQVLSEIEKAQLWRDLLDQLPGRSPIRPFGRPYLYLTAIVTAIQLLKKEGVEPTQLESLIGQTDKIIQATKDTVTRFTELSVGQRSETTCANFASELAAIQAKYPGSDALWLPFMDALQHYKNTVPAVVGEREASKARTVLKNKIKQSWHDLARQIPKQRDLARLYRAYQQRLQAEGRYDFEDMIFAVLKRFKTDDELLARYQEQLQYILIDEFQDTNGAQNETVRYLSSFSEQPNIFVVGDDNQSIFRFQGASLDNLLSFYQRYLASVQVITLRDNYRSQQTLINAASAVINHNQETARKYIKQVSYDLTARTKPDQVTLEHTEYLNEEEECFNIARQVKQLIKAGTSPAAIALLFRANREATQLVQALSAAGVNYRLEAGENALSDRRVRQLISLLQYISSRYEDKITKKADEELARLLHFDFWGISPIEVAKVIYFAANNKLRLYQVISSPRYLKAAAVKNTVACQDIAKKLAQWQVYANNNTLPQTFALVLRESQLLRRVNKDADGLYSLNHINTVFKAIKDGGELDIQQFVQRLTIMREEGLTLKSTILSVENGAVRLMTTHRAKGLEFDHIFVPGLTDRHWSNNRPGAMLKLPRGIVHYNPIDASQNNEDERRLFYVALTRARVGIHLSHAKLSAAGREAVPSLFLLEIPDKNINRLVHHDSLVQTHRRLRQLDSSKLFLQQEKDLLAKWLQTRLKTYTMSVTHLNHYLECPRLFYYRHLLRVPAAKNKHMALGTAVHAALKDFFVAIRNKEQIPSRQYLLSCYQKHLRTETLIDSVLAETLTYGQRILSEYYKRYQTDFNRYQTIREYSFRSHGIRVTNGNLSVPLTGQIDKIELLSDKTINVVDYKTGNPDRAYADCRPGGKYHRQLVFYQLLCDQSTRFNYSLVQGELDFVQKSPSKNKHVKYTYQIDSSQVKALKQEILRVWSEISSLRFLDNSDNMCGQCQYCQLYTN